MAHLATNRFAGDGVTSSYEINFVGKYLDKAQIGRASCRERV